MRVTPPSRLKLDAESLLLDVRARLQGRIPGYAGSEEDPNDPGFLLLEQAAWMVEVLSGQLDQYPFAVIQHLVHTMGGEILPSVPAIGFVVVTPASAGRMEWPADQPAPWRFLTGQTEQADAVEFAPIEAGVDLQPAHVASATRIVKGELFDLATEPGSAVWSRTATPSTVFRRERVRWTIVATDADTVADALRGAVTRLGERGLTWLTLSVAVEGQRVTLDAQLDPLAAFAGSAPEGLLTGGDLVAVWGGLDDCAWTPPLRVADHPALPTRLRGTRPLPAGDGQIVIPGVPRHFPLEHLLVTPPAPLPSNVLTAIWDTLVHLELRLQPLRPIVRREIVEDDGWVSSALDGGVWSTLTAGPPSSAYHVRGVVGPATLRVVIAIESEDVSAQPTVVGWAEAADRSLAPAPVAAARQWGLPLPSPEAGRAMLLAVAYDVPVPAGATGMLVVVSEKVSLFAINGVLVINTPPVQDGREVLIERSVPEVVDLLHPDLVTPRVVQTLVAGPIPPDTAALLRAMPLGQVTPSEGPGVRDWQGILIDPVDGKATVNTLDAEGRTRTFRTGSVLTFDWYRRTDGALGNVPPNAIELVEADAGARPSLTEAVNPLATYYGSAREGERAALDRIFGPRGETPVLASDYERVVRGALGARADGWIVRVWGYSERSLVTTALWPLPKLGEDLDPGVRRFAEELRAAGPDTLVVVLGPATGPMSEADLDWARRVVRRAVRTAGRVSRLHDAIVARCWPLALTPIGAERPALPSHLPTAGFLRDGTGRIAEAPRDTLLLNAAVVRIEEAG